MDAERSDLLSYVFQSTRLMRGVTRRGFHCEDPQGISIHTPHARRDVGLNAELQHIHISIHTPHARRDNH